MHRTIFNLTETKYTAGWEEIGSRQSGACRFLGWAYEFKIYMPDRSVENGKIMMGAGLIRRWASRFQIYMPIGQIDIFLGSTYRMGESSTVTSARLSQECQWKHLKICEGGYCCVCSFISDVHCIRLAIYLVLVSYFLSSSSRNPLDHLLTHQHWYWRFNCCQ